MNTARRRRIVCLLVALTLVSSVTCQTLTGGPNEDGDGIIPTTKEPKSIQKEGYIAYVAGNSLDSPMISQDLFLIRPDGTGLVNLSGTFAWSDSPTWSPDGEQLAFWSDRNGNRDIYVYDLKRQTEQRLTDDPEWDINPSWSPDGSQIAFVSGRDGNLNIYLMNTDGSQQETLTTSENDENYPSWSTDGRRLAFVEETPQFTLKLIQSDGSDETTLAPGTGRAAWSPDGKLLAYAGFYDDPLDWTRPSNNPDILIYNFETQKHTRLTDNPGVDAFPAWSPDGKRLVYESDQGDPQTYTRSLYQIEFKGPVEKFEKGWVSRLTSGEGRNAVWSPPDVATVSPPPLIQPAAPPTVRVCPSGCEYTSIQSAIDSAKTNALIIEVESGTYREKLVIDKSITLRGKDTDGGPPVIDAAGQDEIVLIQAPGVIFEGFHISNAHSSSALSGIINVTSDHNSIIGNAITCADSMTGGSGIRFERASFNAIRNNNLGDCGSIFLLGSSYNQVTDTQTNGLIEFTTGSGRDFDMPYHRYIARFNLAAGNAANQIILDHEVYESRVVSNILSGAGTVGTGVPGSGVGVPGSVGPGTGSPGVIVEPGSAVGPGPTGGGITLNCGPTLNVVAANQLSNNSGIRLTSTGTYNMILKNQISGGNNGISLERAWNELVYGNEISNVSGYGIYIGAMFGVDVSPEVFGTGGGHLIYGNTLLNNTTNAYDGWVSPNGLASLWDNGISGNYHSNYDEVAEGCQDGDGNRICDAPYNIPGQTGAMDNYPLVDQAME